ncbi:MAG TPA: hypothetical protein VMZ90_12655 [Vicinamibacterales bacterium]|nr:hypothetical protein [Vicinamibacterales bacterium]
MSDEVQSSYTLRYRSSRPEVWRFYWRLWRKKLWMVHAALALAAGFAVSPWGVGLPTKLVSALAAFLLLVVISAALSQLLFKGGERVLEVGADGFHTRIGKKVGSRTWSELAPIEEVNGEIAVAAKSGNALIIPSRACESDAQRANFLRDVTRWQLSSR